jgi:hypothetical protein
MDNIRITRETGRNHDRIFIRKHRWILKATDLAEYLQKSVKLDVFKKEIEFEAFMVQNESASAQKWVQKMKNEIYARRQTITMSHYSPKGEEIARKVFSGLRVFGHKCFFDYADSTEATDTVYVKYDSMRELKPIICPLTGITHWEDESYSPEKEPTTCSEKGTASELIASLDADLLDAYKTAGYGQESMALAWAESEQKKRDKETQEVKKPLNLCRKKRQP